MQKGDAMTAAKTLIAAAAVLALGSVGLAPAQNDADGRLRGPGLGGRGRPALGEGHGDPDEAAGAVLATMLSVWHAYAVARERRFPPAGRADFMRLAY